MVLPLAKEPPRSPRTIGSREFEVTEIAPRLRAADITVRANDIRVDVVSLQAVYETGVPNDVARAMPAYLAQVRRTGVPANGKITLSLEYDARVSVKGQEVRVRSIGYTQFFSQFSGNGVF